MSFNTSINEKSPRTANPESAGQGNGPAGTRAFQRPLRTMMIIGLASALIWMTLNPGAAFAIGVWKKGSITKAPWTEDYTYLEVNGNRYTLMPDVAVTYRYQNIDKQIYEDPYPVKKLSLGQRILFTAQGRRIYDVVVLDRSLPND